MVKAPLSSTKEGRIVMRKFLSFIFALLLTFSCASAENHAGALAFEEAAYIVSVGGTLKLKTVAQRIEGKPSYEWLSSDEAIATVKNGKVKGVSGGTLIVSCVCTDKAGTVYTAKCTVIVNVPIQKITVEESNIVLGETPDNAPVAVADYSNRELENFSDDYLEAVAKAQGISVAEVRENKRITLMSIGFYGDQLDAILNGELKIELDNPYYRHKPKVTIEPKNATNQELEWSSSNWNVAEVDRYGTITAVLPGNAVIIGKATDGSGKIVKIEVNVPTFYTTADAVSVEEEQGLIIGYVESSHGRSGKHTIAVEGSCFIISEVEKDPNSVPAYYDRMKYLRIEPKKVGKGSIQFKANGQTLTTVDVIIEKTAVRDKKAYPLYNAENAVENAKNYLGQKVSLVGPFAFGTNKTISIVGEESVDVIYCIDSKQNRIYFACKTDSDSGFLEGIEQTLYGTIDRFVEYVTTTGLEYSIPYFRDVRFISN